MSKEWTFDLTGDQLARLWTVGLGPTGEEGVPVQERITRMLESEFALEAGHEAKSARGGRPIGTAADRRTGDMLLAPGTGLADLTALRTTGRT